MKKKITKNQYYKIKKEVKEKLNKDFAKNYDILSKLISNKKNTIIKYPEYKNAFDYVEGKFPGLNVLNVIIHKVSKQDLIDAKYEGVGGLYIPGKKTIIVSDTPSGGTANTHGKKQISANLSIDEVIVHELLHFVSHKIYRSKDLIMEEEFAYGYSVPYLISKGMTDEQIIKNNMLPFLYGIVDSEKLLKKIIEERKIKPNSYNSYLRKINQNTASKEIVDFVNKIRLELHERTIEIAIKKGQFLVDHYRDVPNGDINDSDNDYDLEI